MCTVILKLFSIKYERPNEQKPINVFGNLGSHYRRSKILIWKGEGQKETHGVGFEPKILV